MNNEKKVKIQQKIIEDLQRDKYLLEQENVRLSDELELEKVIPREGYEKAKALMIELETKKQEYEDLIKETKAIRDEYKEKIKEIKELKVKYKKDMQSAVKQISKSAKKVSKM
jgi:peptidoglycan hydrolase CwlO-like protein